MAGIIRNHTCADLLFRDTIAKSRLDMSRMQTEKHNIRIPVLVPLGLAIAGLMIFSILGAYILQSRNYADRVRTKVDGVQALYNQYIQNDVRLMNGMLDMLKDREDFRQAWLAGDRENLLKVAEPVFKDIRSKYDITHLYFHSPDKTCFLRAHNPSEYGDTITRATMKMVVAQQKPISGIELGKFGTFTLRVMHPWFIDGKLTGYIELGEEIQKILPAVKQVFDVDLVTMIDKQYINQADWEKGMRVMGHENPDWNLMSDAVVVNSTFAGLTQESVQAIKTFSQSGKKSLFGVSVGDTQYGGGSVPLIDAGGRRVGEVIVMKDVTQMRTTLKTFSISLIIFAAVAGFILCGIFYVYIRRIEKRLTGVYTNLNTQVEKRKLAEEQLRDAYTKVEAQVQQRTSELSMQIAEREKTEDILYKLNRELETTVDRLTLVNRELEQFAFITSHHLREPVRKISIFGRMLTESLANKLDDDSKENLNFMIEGAAKIEQMVRGLKLYLEASVEQVDFEQLNMNTMIQQIELQGFDKELRSINGSLVVYNKLPQVKGNHVQIRQVLSNVLSNSLMFRRPDVRLEIAVRSYEQDDGFVRIEIEDNGLGIKDEYLDEIFNPFKKVHAGQNSKGVGIGLTICKKIVERHGGKMGARSDYGHGTVVWFTLPRFIETANTLSATSDSAAPTA
jgi:signal transduction histidine kinase